MKDRSPAVVLTELASTPDAYTLELVMAADAHRGRAEKLITTFSVDWPLERLALVDRLILTLAVGEMLMDDAPPVPVVLDEAVELAKVYSTDGSSSFVNGVLSSIAKELLG